MDFALLGFVAVTFVAALGGALWTPGPWYAALARPWWTPPNWAFPVVWTLLYAMIAVSGWVAWHAAGGVSGAPLAFAIFGLQLFFNFIWSKLFFGMRRMDLALADSAAMWLAIAANIWAFHALDPRAAWLLVPYLVWVTIAFALNLAILRLNPSYGRI